MDIIYWTYGLYRRYIMYIEDIDIIEITLQVCVKI